MPASAPFPTTADTFLTEFSASLPSAKLVPDKPSRLELDAAELTSLPQKLASFCVAQHRWLLGAAPLASGWQFSVGQLQDDKPQLLNFDAVASSSNPVAAATPTSATRGLFVVFLGADGSGKSSVIAALESSVAPAFTDITRYHLRPHFGADRSGSPVVTDPHGQAPRSPLTSLAKLGLWGTDYLWGYWASVRGALTAGRLVIFDRYYYDLLVDPARYRYGAPLGVARAVAQLVPKPDLVLLLDAPAEVLQSRKQEVSPEESARQRAAYRALVGALAQGHILDAAQPLKDVSADATRHIFDALAAQTRRQLRLA